jgi:hypothetical protein
MGEKASAFWKGGCGCLALVVAVGLCFVLIGGQFNIDVCGAMGIFVVGGLLGLIALAVYNKGKRDAISPQSRNPNREWRDFD